ncbi:MAG: hypothetical protein IJ172_00455 [Ruminococcus sp.]|nr:hypothetical protein [Ruminococcus sp.]MBQ8119236.1 hypothetical protein [Ruminococcus sp.]
MARFSLNIYGKNDEIIKTYETEHVRFGVLMQALEISEKNLDNVEKLKAAMAIVKALFNGLTDKDLSDADTGDVLALFIQVTRMSDLLAVPKN